MTQRELFVAAIDVLNKRETEVSVEEIAEGLTSLITKMDEKNAKRRKAIANGTASRKVDAETLAKREAILGVLNGADEPMTSEQIGEAAGFSKNTVSGVLRAYVTSGEVVKGKIKMEGADGKMHEYVTYAKAAE